MSFFDAAAAADPTQQSGGNAKTVLKEPHMATPVPPQNRPGQCVQFGGKSATYVCSLDKHNAWVVINTTEVPGTLELAPIQDLTVCENAPPSHFANWLEKHDTTLAQMGALSTAIQYIDATTDNPDDRYLRMAKADNAPAATLESSILRIAKTISSGTAGSGYTTPPEIN